MNAPVIETATATPILHDEIASAGDWPELLTIAHVRIARLIVENCALRARLSVLAPLMDEWPDYDRWAAAAREYRANRGGRR